MVFLQFHILYLFNKMLYMYIAQFHPWADSQVVPSHAEANVLCEVDENLPTIFTETVNFF